MIFLTCFFSVVLLMFHTLYSEMMHTNTDTHTQSPTPTHRVTHTYNCFILWVRVPSTKSDKLAF